LTKIDHWFLHNIKEIVELEGEIASCRDKADQISPELMVQAKRHGFYDTQLARVLKKSELWVYEFRKQILPVFKLAEPVEQNLKLIPLIIIQPMKQRMRGYGK
jgi:carbamoyl-phosphate synthase large subunit